MPLTRIAYVTTANTGAAATITTPEGTIKMQRFDPDGVLLQVDGKTFSLSKEALPFLGRFFLAAALELGQDINAGWGQEQTGGQKW
jgi:hypothetical protein